jgi:hypothetical protein
LASNFAHTCKFTGYQDEESKLKTVVSARLGQVAVYWTGTSLLQSGTKEIKIIDGRSVIGSIGNYETT